MMEDRKHIMEKLQEDIVIPKQVQAKTEETLASILKTQKSIVPMKTKSKTSKRKIIFLAAAAVAVLGTVTVGAAVYLNWSHGIEMSMHATQEDMKLIEDKNMNTFVGQSVTQSGVTVTAEQSIVDNHYALISFKVEGYELSEGAAPYFEITDYEIEGLYSGIEENMAEVDYSKIVDMSAGFYDGFVSDGYGGSLKEDNTPLGEGDQKKYVMEDGSMEYQITLSNTSGNGNLIGKEIHLTLKNLGTVSKAEFQPDLEAAWDFTWTLGGSSEIRKNKLNAPLGETGATVVASELSPISMKVEYEFPRSYTKEEAIDENGAVSMQDMPVEPPELTGVRMKDGTMYPIMYMGPGSSGYQSEDSDRYQYTFAIDRILDVGQVESLLFVKSYPEDGESFTEDNFYIVPLMEQ